MPGPRVDLPELMDTAPVGDREMRRALDFLALTNRRFGGWTVLARHLARLAAPRPDDGPLEILDAGCGGGDLLVRMAAWARAAGRPARITGIDLTGSAVRAARDRTAGRADVRVLEGDVFAHLAGGARYDVVTASLFLHHLPDARLVPALKAFDAAARRAVIVSDLERSTPGRLAVGALAWVAGNRVVRHDGPLSVRRAFTVPELAALAREAGLAYLRAAREPWFRVSLAGIKTGGA